MAVIEQQPQTETMFFERVYSAQAVGDRMDDLVSLYREAFASPPENERTICANEKETLPSCPGGFSALAVGQICAQCELEVTQEAYPAGELRKRFAEIADGPYPAVWYLEETGMSKQIGLAVLARTLPVADVAEVKYPDNPEMAEWLANHFGNRQANRVVWLDEIFANTALRQSGNLTKFESMCRRLAKGADVGGIAFRTLNPKLVHVAQKEFGSAAKISDPAFGELPDYRKFVEVTI